MNPEVKKKWVAALRSGEYKQGKNYLKDNLDNFCCLGVLCDLHRKETCGVWREFSTIYKGLSALPSVEVLVWAGLRKDALDQVGIEGKLLPLSYHNDLGRTFAEIADAIEAQL